MSNFMGLMCPQCHCPDGLTVDGVVYVTGRLRKDGYDWDGGDSEILDDGDAYCDRCGWAGLVKDLLRDDGSYEEEDKEEEKE